MRDAKLSQRAKKRDAKRSKSPKSAAQSIDSDTSTATCATVKRNADPKGALQQDSNPEIQAYYYSMAGHAEKCVERYCELAHCSPEQLPIVSTPGIDDHLIHVDKFETKGVLSPVCSRIVLKVHFFARIARPDLLASVNTLAREVTRWTAACGDRLKRLIAYIHCTKNWVIRCFIGDEPQQCQLAVYADASFAGDLRDSKSTSAVSYTHLTLPTNREV